MAFPSMTMLLVWAGLTLASPVPVSSSAAAIPTPQVNTDQQFTLVAKVISSTLDIDIHNWVIGGTRVEASQFALTLTEADPLSDSAGRLYQQGNITDTACGVGDNIVRAASSLSLGFIITDNSPSNYDTCSLSSQGDPTPGVGIGKDESGVPYLVGNGKSDGQYYVCKVQVQSELLPSLSWRAADTPAPNGCADVKLVPQCAGQLPSDVYSTQDLVPNLCLSDAANFDAPAAIGNPNGDGQVVVPPGSQG